jgi:cell division protein FtsB
VSTASDIAALKAAVTTLQQRCTRLENEVKTLQTQLAKVKKG